MGWGPGGGGARSGGFHHYYYHLISSHYWFDIYCYIYYYCNLTSICYAYIIMMILFNYYYYYWTNCIKRIWTVWINKLQRFFIWTTTFLSVLVYWEKSGCCSIWPEKWYRREKPGVWSIWRVAGNNSSDNNVMNTNLFTSFFYKDGIIYSLFCTQNKMCKMT